ncbi:DoxX family membrane protein [Flagellimonas sp. 2504JD1-5]
MESNITQVKSVLRYTYGLVPIVAGLDKFTNLLTDWGQYISSGFTDILPMETGAFMMIVGIIEIVAGILVLLKPKIGALVVMSWLIAIAMVLIFSGKYIDIAVRDLVMAIGAFSLAKLYTAESS